ncbi:MAG: LysM peptidoglycan-binding domain-containing protein [Deltaproteobacteria bacterium]|jgi:LysM repeat protein|nr:LysM peptidoglycan-binding domain-containing protein [Deltaproteobacteria bacterium]
MIFSIFDFFKNVKILSQAICLKALALALISVIFLTLAPGCSGVSDDDLLKLSEENEALAKEVEEAKKEGEILNRALTGVYKERDRLTDLLKSQPLEPPPTEESASADNRGPTNPPRTSSPAAAEPATTQSGQSNNNQIRSAPQRRVYEVKSGDTVSNIALANKITPAIVLELNPQISRRSNSLVLFVGEKLILPDSSSALNR